MDRHAAERGPAAMIPSAYYSWLCDQVARDDEIGRLAAHAMLDADWPRTESDKTVLRAYLRGKGLKALVQPLAESFGEFSQSVDTHIHQQAQGMGRALELARAKMAGPAYRAWRALGCPTREEVVALAERGDAAAEAILGLRVLLGVESPANPLFGVRKLAAAFANGFRPAARILELYYSCSLDM